MRFTERTCRAPRWAYLPLVLRYLCTNAEMRSVRREGVLALHM